MKLTTMTDFVLEQESNYDMFNPKGNECELQKRYNNNFHYAYFLKQPLELWMFVPCAKDGNVLELPTKENSLNTIDHESKMMDYADAKERCLFEGFECKHIKTTHDNYYIINNKNITWLSWNNSKII